MTYGNIMSLKLSEQPKLLCKYCSPTEFLISPPTTHTTDPPENVSSGGGRVKNHLQRGQFKKSGDKV